MKFHINSTTGDIGPCRATKGKCPFGGTDGTENHYDSIVDAAKAYERSMAGTLLKQEWHWNPRTNKPAWCPNHGCPIGAPDSEHYASQDEVCAAQEQRWQTLLDQNALKGKELTAAINFAQDPKYIRYGLEKGNMNQAGMVLYRINSRTFWQKQDASGDEVKTELVNAYKTLAQRRMHVKNPMDFIYSSPTDPTKWDFFSDNDILSHEEIKRLFLQQPTFFLMRGTDELAIAENRRLLTQLEDEANRGGLSKEEARYAYSMLNSSDETYPTFRKQSFRQEPGLLWDQFVKARDALYRASQ